MRILLTGASSFTGMWFAEALSLAGATIIMPLPRRVEDYQGTRGLRVKHLQRFGRIVPETPFGGDPFMSLIRREQFDSLCHHAARVHGYRSLDFDFSAALAANTNNIRAVLEVMGERGLKAVVATGTVFEADEGVGDHPLRAFSPYGLSKGMTWQTIRYWCTVLGIPCGKFVIPNPFGPLDEPKYPHYLMSCWQRGEPAEVRTPTYVRDNIHVDLLALSYARFVQSMVIDQRDGRIGPSGYREPQGAFTERFAREMRSRLDLACEVVLLEQQDFSEPLVRLNPHTLDVRALRWDERIAWDKFADSWARDIHARAA